ncbi:MAG: pyruvate, phosphate dikinase [Candidatus Gracilibacteria bacterium]|nr:pyruvate, phosphate dikinase [Candidatus Gracilibacteria bacterium]MDD5178857.1 pyruvate, phosphate dikinase [Candidatus Gracilibacteria bacterium]
MPKRVYAFSEGNAKMKDLLGGKGANLAEMTNLGIPVPPGFTITTEACAAYAQDKKLPAGLLEEVEKFLKRLEKEMGKKLGDADNPLLVSVRSGAASSMPGMMDTVLNLGMNDESVLGLIAASGNERFAYDVYRRFIQMFGNVVLGVSHDEFEAEIEKMKHTRNVKNDVDLDAEDLKELVMNFKKVVRKTIGRDFPQNPLQQLELAIKAVFESWNNPRAIYYRQMNKLKGMLGTAVNVQAMVFGNLGNDSGTGVAFTRDPGTGEKRFFGEYLMNAQGEDVVAGIRTPLTISHLKKENPRVYSELEAIYKRVEKHYADMQDMEFTIEGGKLFLLQTRNGKRTAKAAVRIAVELVKEKMISEKEAVLRIDAYALDQLLHPTLDPKAKKVVIAKGLPASPGAACGTVVFTADEAEKQGKAGKSVILVRKETSPEDIHGMNQAKGILTARGGMTSHAAVVARGMGKCCVAGAEMIQVDSQKKQMKIGTKIIREGEVITLDGGTGEVILGKIATIEPKLDKDFAQLMKWADKYRKLKVRANADTPHDAAFARSFGAEGIGLTRTEHMFFQPKRIMAVREMIVAETEEARRKALAKLLPYQRDDFYAIFKAMKGLPVTVRLLDPPLHEFLPSEEKEIKALAKDLNITEEKLRSRMAMLHEVNPMMGLRGARLMVTYPEIVEMQARAIFEAAVKLKKEKVDVIPEVMIPLIGFMEEYYFLAEIVRKVAGEIIQKSGVQLKYAVGTMIEIPRACIRARKIARKAEFFSFGTNDLTQLTFGFSRDDAPKFVPTYIERGILESDPFSTLDQRGVGALIKMGIEKGRKDRKDLKCGICGEHGGDPASVEFCHRVGMNYVSCSPFRVPVARLAAAQAALREK